MAGLFAKPRVVTAPVVAPALEPPPVAEEEVGVAAAGRRRRRSGRRQTFITGELEPETLGKKRLLG